ncbi:MAG: pirin family protein [Coprobacillaceae bacterium]
MLRYIDHKKMGRSELGWLDSHFHFSFAEYYNPNNTHFGTLRVLNDDMVKAGTGFDTHPHQDFEIISYVVDGELTHADSMKNQHTLKRGQVQYMSAGTGVTHSEHNWGHDTLRFLQIWFFPDKKGYAPNYGDYRFDWKDRQDKWLPIASGDGDERFPIQIHADIHAYATEIAEGDELSFTVEKGRQAYLVLIEGEAKVKDITMYQRDALEITEEEITIHANKNAHMLLIEMAKEI